MTISIACDCDEEEIFVAPWLVLAKMNDEIMRRQREMRVRITGKKVLHNGKRHVLVDMTNSGATLRHRDNVIHVPIKSIMNQLDIKELSK